MATARGLLALAVSFGLLGCQLTTRVTKPRTGVPATVAATGVGPAGPTGAGLISEHGGALIANNGGGLTGKSKIPTGLVANNAGSLIADAGGSVVANNAGNVVANNAGNIVANHGGGYHTLGVEEAPLVGFPVTIVDAAGNPVLDANQQPYRTTTGKDGTYTFARTPRGANLVVRIDLPPAVGPMYAYLPTAEPGAARVADVSAVSTLVMGYVLAQYVVGQPDPVATLQKLPGDVEAATRAKADNALTAAPELVSFRPEVLVPKVDALKAADAAFGQQVEAVRKLLIAGLSDVGEGQNATSVALSFPKYLARLSDGSLLIAERDGHRVRRLDVKTGKLTTLAGKDGATAVGDGGPATDAFIDRPVSLAVDTHDNVYICDFGHHLIRRVDGATHVITSVAGSGNPKPANEPIADGTPALTANLKFPRGIAVDAQGRPVFESENGTFRVEADGTLRKLGILGEDPHMLTNGPDGKVYGLDTTTGQVLVLDGNGFSALSLPTPVVSDSASLSLGADGTFYLTDTDKLLSLAPGAAAWKPVPFAAAHGDLSATLPTPEGLAVVDGGFNRIWRLPPGGGPAVAIAGLDASTADALAANSLSLNRPTALVFAGPGRLLVSDGLNNVIWERRQDGLYYRFAGGTPAKGTDTDIGDGGPARNAKLLKTLSLAHLHDGTVLIGEADQPLVVRVRAVDPDGVITTRPLPDGIVAPAYMVEDKDGSVLCSDYISGKVMRWTDTTAAPVIQGDGPKAAGGIAIAPDESLYVTDVKGHAVYHVVNGVATKVIGGNDAGFAGDGGDATKAQLDTPLGIALGPDGNLYVADSRNNRVRRWHPATGTIETVVGLGSQVFAGSTPDDTLKEPIGLVFDTNGDLYIADSGHNQIKRVEAAKLP